jgi:hypothetical protein
MKTLSPDLAAHVAGEVTSLATCWRLERTDGWVRGFTDHDQNLVVEGVTYVAATGFLPSAIKSGSDLSVDNLDVDGFLNDEALKAEDLTAGLFDGAKIDIFLVNWADLSQGRVLLRRGSLGEVKRRIAGLARPSSRRRTGDFSAPDKERSLGVGDQARGRPTRRPDRDRRDRRLVTMRYIRDQFAAIIIVPTYT